MIENPILQKLGLSKTDRLVIIHTDDIGMCQASVSAYSDLLNFGLISSAAVMVPCSWFPQVASLCREEQKVDMGVHLTLTSEWEYYRWSPISTTDVNSGLIDPDGYFFHTSEEFQTFGNPEATQIELRSQVDKALKCGLFITHLDTHMNSIAHPKFIASYIQLAVKYKLPLLYPRMEASGFQKLGFDPEISILAAQSINYLEEVGIPLVDFATGLNLVHPENRFEQVKILLYDLPAGITHFIIHPSKDTPELRAITPDWKCRVADYQTFMSDKTKHLFADLGLQVIGYKNFKNLIQ